MLVECIRACRFLRLRNYLRDICELTFKDYDCTKRAKPGNLQMSLLKLLLIVCLDLIFVFRDDLETFKNCFVMSC